MEVAVPPRPPGGTKDAFRCSKCWIWHLPRDGLSLWGGIAQNARLFAHGAPAIDRSGSDLVQKLAGLRLDTVRAPRAH